MEKKAFVAQFKKFEGEGRGLAIFASMQVIDRDHDVTIPGAFGEQTVKLAQAHQWQVPNIGMAKIRESGNDALADFQFYLDMAAGREWFSALKNNFDNGVPQEWSYGFNIEDSGAGEFEGQPVRFLKRLKVHEVSPVMVGAGIDTRTLDIKEEKNAIGSHSTPTDDAAWDAGANEKRVRADEAVGYYKKIYAWQDPEADPKTKTAWKFIHHEVDGDGNPGAANTRACSATVAILNGGRGVDVGAQPWGKDRKGIWNHVAAHLRDADMEPPPLKDAPEQSMKLEDHFIFVETSLAEALKLFERLEDLKSLRAKEGRELSRANRERLGKLTTRLRELEGELSAARSEIDTLLHNTDPENIQRLAEQFANYQHTLAKIRGHLN